MNSPAQDLQVMRYFTQPSGEIGRTKLVVLVCGLPGTGKTTLAVALCQKYGLVHLESDFLRRKLFGRPTHLPEESIRLYNALYDRAEELLEEGYGLLLDSTNLIESHREICYRMTHEHGCKQIIIMLECSPNQVRTRLKKRVMAQGNDANADWSVYLKLARQIDAIKPRHFVLNTSKGGALDKAIEIIDREIADD